MRIASEFEEQDWQRIQEGDHVEDEVGDEMNGSAELFECVACSKVFSSNASWLNHERSKKHKQAVYR